MVTNGQLANQTTFNNAFMSRTASTTSTVAIVSMNNTDLASGASISNAQGYINQLADTDGLTGFNDANRKVYSSNNVVTDGDDRKVAIGKLDAKFDFVTGHAHDGTAGNGAPVSATSLSDFNDFIALRQTFTYSGASGTDIDISTEMSGKTPGGDDSTAGVPTVSPRNIATILESSTLTALEDAEGQRVYGRITESGGVWTLSFYTNEGGVETAHSLTSTDIRVFFSEVFTMGTRPTFNEDTGYIDSLDLTADVVDASDTQSGKVNISSQSFAGEKTFISGIVADFYINPILDNSVSIGNDTLAFSSVTAWDMFSNAFNAKGGGITGPTFISYNSFGIQQTDDADIALTMTTADDSNIDAVATNDISIATGNKTDGTGNSGNIYMASGTSAGGDRGYLSLNFDVVIMNDRKIVALADPTDAQDAATKAYVDANSGGGGGGGFNWIDTLVDAPTLDQEYNIDVYLFEDALTQYLYGELIVPTSYTPGTQIFLNIPWHSPSTSDDVLIQTQATLIRTGVDAVSDTTNQYTSSNTAITNTAPADLLQTAECDLTDVAGEINGVAVSAGDKILVRLTRDTATDTDTASVRVHKQGTEPRTS